ncbi:hypothetical protein Tco_0996361 [Tanacetum coccineum]
MHLCGAVNVAVVRRGRWCGRRRVAAGGSVMVMTMMVKMVLVVTAGGGGGVGLDGGAWVRLNIMRYYGVWLKSCKVARIRRLRRKVGAYRR